MINFQVGLRGVEIFGITLQLCAKKSNGGGGVREREREYFKEAALMTRRCHQLLAKLLQVTTDIGPQVSEQMPHVISENNDISEMI